jgi:MFS family permease
MPLTLSIAALSMGGSARLIERIGPVPTLAGGLVSIMGGLTLLASQGVGAAYFPGLFVAFMLIGLGAGAAFLPLLTLGMADAPARDAGLASGIVNVSVQLFGAIGLATLGTIATDHTKALAQKGEGTLAALTGGYHMAYLVAAAAVGLGVLAALVVLRNPSEPVVQETDDELERIESVQAAEPVAQAA